MDRERINDREFSIIRTINRNDRKSTQTSIVRDANGSYFLKRSTGPVSRAFRREIEFYRNHENANFLPRLIEAGDDFLLLEQLHATSLRRTILDGGHIPLDAIVEQLRRIYGPPLIRRSSAFSEAVRLLGLRSNLVNSAPEGAFRSRSRWRRLWFLASAPFMLLRYWFSCMHAPVRSFAIGHGDLHLNNVLLADGRAYVIDWENAGATSVAGDLAYFFSMLLNFRDDPEVYEAFEAIIADHDPRIKRLCRVSLRSYRQAIATNPAFGPLGAVNPS